MPHVALRLWGKRCPRASPEGAAGRRCAARDVEAMGAPQCGPAAGNLSRLVRRRAASTSLARARAARPDAQLRAARARQRGSAAFLPEMGTLYLRRIGELRRGRARREALVAKRVAERATATHPDEDLVHAYLDALRHQRRLSAATLAATAMRSACCARSQDARLEALDTAQAAPLRRAAACAGLSGAHARADAVGLARPLPLARAPPPVPRQPGAGRARARRAAQPLPKALSVEEAQQLLDGERRRARRNCCATRRCSSCCTRRACASRSSSRSTATTAGSTREGEVTVTGKGAKTRTVPVGARAREALRAVARGARAACAPGRSARSSSARAAGASRRAWSSARLKALARSAAASHAGPPARAAPFVRHPRAAVVAGPARGAGDARPRQHLDHAGLHAPRFPGARQGLRRGASARASEK